MLRHKVAAAINQVLVFCRCPARVRHRKVREISQNDLAWLTVNPDVLHPDFLAIGANAQEHTDTPRIIPAVLPPGEFRIYRS
ncbi:MAG: hypothetical protein NXH74_14205 [Rhodobacteraceae bacterium]|nr:hypothetical protein [Paracoccaceae bacterium]